MKKTNSQSFALLMAYSLTRGALYSLERKAMNNFLSAIPGSEAMGDKFGFKTFAKTRLSRWELYAWDIQNIKNGIYPSSVLKPLEPIQSHFHRLPKLIKDGWAVYQRKKRGEINCFSPECQEKNQNLPAYYRRNFHFQTDGYLSEHSAELYDHQVELLFAGSANSMRRLLLPALKKFSQEKPGKELKILEIACGTGTASRFTSEMLPNAKLISTDISEAYIQYAQKRHSERKNIQFQSADACNLPFEDGSFDAVFSVFLFHEMPVNFRKQVLAECKRVLKPGGFIGAIDSIQIDDEKIFNPVLGEFPKNYHEPFYLDYIKTPLEGLFEESGFINNEKLVKYFSKAVWGRKAELS